MVETRYLTLPEGRVAYDDQGAGPVVICMPGIGDIRAEYRLLTPQLLAAGFRVVTMDPRGQGETSARWPDYSVAAIAGDALALARELRAGPVYLIGNSRAGGVAAWAAAEAPELVAGVVMIAPFARDSATPRWQARLLHLGMYTPLFSGPWGPVVWRRYMATLYPTGKPDDLAPYLARVEATMREPGRMRALLAIFAPAEVSYNERLSRVTAPSLIIFGTNDRDFAEPETEARALASALGGPTRVELIAGAGHYPHAEMAERTGALITAFLKELRDQRRAASATEVAYGA